MAEEKKEFKMNIKIDDADAVGKFCNMANVGFSPEEFSFDYIYFHPITQFAKLLSRIVMTPAHAKRFMLILQKHIELYEKQNGAIEVKMPSQSTTNIIKH